VLHAEVGGRRGKRPRDLPATAEDLSTCDVDYVALGHRHEHREFKVSGALWGAYPGTPFGLSFRAPELDARSACLVTIEAGEEPRVERLPSSDALWMVRELDVDEIASPQELADAARGVLEGGRVVRLQLRGAARFPVDADALRAELAGELAHLEVEDSSVEIAIDSLGQLAEEQSVRGIFARRMLERLAAVDDGEARAEATAALREGLRALAEEE
jgi:DNA repair exonuclease SbcCD nuclease subunit